MNAVGQDAAEPQPSPGALSNRRGSIRNSISKPLTSKEKRMSMSAASSGNDFDLSNELNTAIMESDTALIAEAKKHNDVAGMLQTNKILRMNGCYVDMAWLNGENRKYGTGGLVGYRSWTVDGR